MHKSSQILTLRPENSYLKLISSQKKCAGMCTDMLSFIYNPQNEKLGGSQTPILAHFAFQLAHCAAVLRTLWLDPCKTVMSSVLLHSNYFRQRPRWRCLGCSTAALGRKDSFPSFTLRTYPNKLFQLGGWHNFVTWPWITTDLTSMMHFRQHLRTAVM